MANAEARLERQWFRDLSTEVLTKLQRELADTVWIKPTGRSAQIVDTNSGGWAANLGAVRGDRGSHLQLWFDHWTGGAHRKVAYSYSNASPKRMTEMAESGVGGMGIARHFTDAYTANEGIARFNMMHPPLPQHLFGKSLVELTLRPGYRNFLAVYEGQRPNVSNKPSRTLTERAATFLVEAADAAHSSSQRSRDDRPYPTVKNRAAVRNHIVRERSAGQASVAKRRANYTCQVCDLQFVTMYGEWGRNYAEAHHTAFVSRLRKGATIRIEDLLTVCANCHRMLHRMEGNPDDWRKLKATVRKLRRR